ncbi:12209_t:CDS:2, partial [Cetraspora pellucida]
KFMIKDGIEYMTVAYAYIVGISDSKYSFKADEISKYVLHYMFPMMVKHNPKLHDNSIYFIAKDHVYNSFTTHKTGWLFIVASFIRFEKPNIITIEATDIDYLSSFKEVKEINEELNEDSEQEDNQD